MPIYELYCSACDMIFNFLSRNVNTTTRPKCPRCGQGRMERMISGFAMTGKAKEDSDAGNLPVDDAKMEKAMETLAREAEGMNEDDPRHAAGLLRKVSGMTGLKLGEGMEEALNRLEFGEDPEQIEEEMGDSLAEEDPFLAPDEKGRRRARPRRVPRRDPKLYEM